MTKALGGQVIGSIAIARRRASAQRVAGEDLQPAVDLARPERDLRGRAAQRDPGPAARVGCQPGERVIQRPCWPPGAARGSRSRSPARPRAALRDAAIIGAVPAGRGQLKLPLVDGCLAGDEVRM